jgi:O-antigen/teichoic acid export membrane protein
MFRRNLLKAVVIVITLLAGTAVASLMTSPFISRGVAVGVLLGIAAVTAFGFVAFRSHRRRKLRRFESMRDSALW